MVMPNELYIRLISFFLILCTVALWENRQPQRELRLAYRRWPLNLSLVVINSVLVKLLIPAGAVGVALWCEAQQFGLLHVFQMPMWLNIMVAVVLLDFFIYVQHVLVHKIPLLWRLHQVHHADCDMDVSTALRFHPLEILLSMLIKMGLVALLGAPVIAVILFEIILNGMAMFNHGNIRLPLWLDLRLRWFMVTPDMHRIHHSVIRHETDSNYGFNLAIWDRLFATYRAYPKNGQSQMVVGLKPFQQPECQTLKNMMRLPFKPLRH